MQQVGELSFAMLTNTEMPGGGDLYVPASWYSRDFF